jgi:periplasmic protein TonB
MFERYVSTKSEPRGRARPLAFAASALLNGGLVAGLIVWSFWDLEKVHAKSVPVVFTVAAAPPPPPPPPPPPATPAVVARRKVVTPQELVQPIRQVADERPIEPVEGGATSTVAEAGEAGGVEGGTPGSTGGEPGGAGGPGAGDEPPTPVDVLLEGVEAQRVAGTRELSLPAAVKQAMVARGTREAAAAVKLCLDASGRPARIEVMRSTGFPEADERIRLGMSEWRYRPYRVNGMAVPVCTAVVFRYRLE